MKKNLKIPHTYQSTKKIAFENTDHRFQLFFHFLIIFGMKLTMVFFQQTKRVLTL